MPKSLLASKARSRTWSVKHQPDLSKGPLRAFFFLRCAAALLCGLETLRPLRARAQPFGSGYRSDSRLLNSGQKKRGGLTRPHFFRSPCYPFHHPDESRPAMSLAVILDSLCLSVDTVRILEFPAFGATWKIFQEKSPLAPQKTNKPLFFIRIGKDLQRVRRPSSTHHHDCLRSV
jgi:hypothetical protein